MATTCDAIIIGTGQAGPFLSPTSDSVGDESRDHRAQVVRWYLCQHGLYSDQDMVASAYAAHMARRASRVRSG